VKAIDFVELQVADLDRWLRFYRETLGMDFPVAGGGDDWRELRFPPVALAFGQYREPGSVLLALAVDDVDAAGAELRARGVEIVKEPRAADVYYRALIRGPDGTLYQGVAH